MILIRLMNGKIHHACRKEDSTTDIRVYYNRYVKFRFLWFGFNRNKLLSRKSILSKIREEKKTVVQRKGEGNPARSTALQGHLLAKS